MEDIDAIYSRIGEFVVVFQELENKFREMGWLILDPNRSEWPPRALRDENNFALINKVEALHSELMDSLAIEDGEERKLEFRAIATACHGMRGYRNNLLHSAFIELKAGGEVRGILRSNPKINIDEETGETIFDQELLSAQAIQNEMLRLGELFVALSKHYIQLIHWAPFDSLRKGG
jgi:hypothetical protein